MAVKLLTLGDPDAEETAQQRQWVLREARAAGLLSHPNIVTVHDVGEQESYAYIVMELVDGADLGKLIDDGKPLSDDDVFRILRATASALDFAHGKGIFHRDIKPGNILIETGGAVKLVDFGLAKFETGTKLTQTGIFVGTPQYMSPEQIQGTPVNGRSDQFSLAIVAYELLTRKLPFEGESLVFQLLQKAPPPVREHRPELSESFDSVLRKALAKNPGDRYPDCTSFVGDLERVRRGEAPALGDIPHTPATTLRPRRRRWPLAAALAAPLLVAGALTFWSLSPPNSGPAKPAPEQPPAQQESSRPDQPESAPEAQPPAAKGDEPLQVQTSQPEPDHPEPPPPAPPKTTLPVETPAVRAETAPPEEPAVRTGTVVWFGRLAPNGELTIEGSECSAGEVTRPLPGRPVNIRITPSTLTIVEPPREANGWRRVRIRNAARPLETFVLTYSSRQ